MTTRRTSKGVKQAAPKTAQVKPEVKKPAVSAPVKTEEKKPAAAPVKAEEKKPAAAPVKAEEKKPAAAPVKTEEKKTAATPVKTESIATGADKAKAIETKKDTTKVLETRAAVLKAEPVKKAEPKKAEAKKPAVKKPAAKKEVKELVPELYLQFAGKEYSEKDILQKVKDVWTKELKNKVGDMKDVKIYLKPEENSAYYVINGDTTGRVEL